MSQWLTLSEGAARTGKKEDTLRKHAQRHKWEKRKEGEKTLYCFPSDILPVSELADAAIIGDDPRTSPSLREIELMAQLAVEQSEHAVTRDRLSAEKEAHRVTREINAANYENLISTQEKLDDECARHVVTKTSVVNLEKELKDLEIEYACESLRLLDSQQNEGEMQEANEQIRSENKKILDDLNASKSKNKKNDILLSAIKERDENYNYNFFYERLWRSLPEIDFSQH